MIQNRLRLIGLALLVFVVVPFIALRQMDQADKARRSLAGKVQIVHFWGIPEVAETLEDQVTIAVYRRFLDKPENKNPEVVIQRFSGLEIKELPASWDAMIQMAFAADRAPDIVELVTENIQTHREEGFIRPLPDEFTFHYSLAAYDDDSGFRQEAIAGFRQARAEQERIYQAARQRAREQGQSEEQWLPEAARAYDLALMRKTQEMSEPGQMLPGQRPPLCDLLDAWNDLMRRSGQKQLVTTAPDGEMAGEPLSAEMAWHRWIFEKTQAKVPTDLLRALYDLKTGKLYGADEGEPSLIGLRYRVKPFREANLVDRTGRAIIPQTWDELEFWSIAISLLGEGTASDGKVGYRVAHGQLIPYPFPLYAYGAGGLTVVPVPEGGNPAAGGKLLNKNEKPSSRWTCALDSPGTIRGMAWLRHMAFLRPIKLDYRAAGPDGQQATYPLVLIYDQKSPFFTVPAFYLRLAGEGQQVVIRRLTLTDDFRVTDRGRELFRFAGKGDLIDRLKQPASQSPGQCSPTRPMDKNDLDIEKRLWGEDKLAMTPLSSRTMVVDNPDAEGRSRHPDGPPWDLMVTEDQLKDAAALRRLQADLAALGIKADLTVSDGDWAASSEFLKGLAAVKDAPAREGPTGEMPGPQVTHEMPRPLRRVMDELARVGLPAELNNLAAAIKPARPTWADPVDLDRDRTGRWNWVHLVSPDGATLVTVQRKYVIQRAEYEAWPGGPRFLLAPTAVDGGRYAQFVCGLQVPADQVVRKDTYRIQTAIIDMGMISLNQRMNDRTEGERQRLDAAIRLIAYLSGGEAEKISIDKQVENGLGTTLNPVLLRKYGYNQIADSIPADYEEAMRNIRRIGRAVPAVPNYRGFQQFLANLGDRMVIQGEDPAAACKAVAATVNKRFLSEADENVMVARRKVAWVVFAMVLASLLVAAVWIGWQLIRGLSARLAAGDGDIELGSVGQRATKATHLAAWLFLAPAVASILVWSYLPLGWGSIMAFQEFHVVKPTKFIGLDNFIRIFVDPQFYVILGNTFYFVFLSLSLEFLAPVVLALMLNEIPWGKIFYRTVFYLPAITSGLVILFMWKQFYQPDKFGLLNTLLTRMNDLGPAATFGVKLLGIAAIPGLAVALFALPLRDDIETGLGRFFAALPPLGLTMWLGYRAPGNPLPLMDTLTAKRFGSFAAAHLAVPFYLALAILAFACGLALLREAYKSENEFARRRIPWAAPGMAVVFLAGWLLRFAATSVSPAADVSPQSTSSHMAQLFVLLLPLIGGWPILRRLFGKEHTPRESMYLLLRKPADGPAFAFSKPARWACTVTGGAIVLLAGVGFLLADGPTAVAFRYLLAAASGWLRQPFVLEPLLWLKDPALAMVCIILPGVWADMGPGCLIYLAGLKGIPDDVYEAADLDGAGTFQKVWTITVPHLLALLIINFVGAFIAAFQATQNVLVMTAGGPADATLVLGLEVWLDAFVLLKFGYATALAWILGLILIGFTMYQVSILKKVQFKAAGMK